MTNSPLQQHADFAQFLKVLTRTGVPTHLPCYEHVASPGFIARRMGVPFQQMTMDDEIYWETYVGFWLGMGFDCVPIEIPLNCPLPSGHGATSEESEAKVVFRTLAEAEAYPWPDDAHPLDFRHYETAARYLPAGVKLVAGVCAGPYEWASMMLGTVGLSYALADEPELVEYVFARIGRLHTSAVRQLATMDAIGALRQGDDLGFKSSTFLPPALLRQFVFPTYRAMVDLAHAQGKPFILHSCGNLAEVYDDLVDIGIDAKHSFEDIILPVEEFKRQYGTRMTPLGGLDVDTICRSDEASLRAYTRHKVEQCFADGYWAIGTGNSLTDYMPVENYLIVLDEARRMTTG